MKAHAPSPLTARFVETVRQPGRYGDGRGGSGLCLNVRKTANGRASKSWVQRVRPGGRPTYIGLGRYPHVTLAEARKVALANAIAVSKGADPRTGTGGVPTFAAALDAVLDVQRPMWRHAGKSEAQWRASLRDYAGALMSQPVDRIEAGDVLAVLTPIWNDKRETARRVRQRIGAVMRWSIAAGHRTDNPVDAIGAALPNNGHRRAHHRAVPYAAVGDALATIRRTNAWRNTVLAFEFLVLTAARSGEVRGARWEEIDLDLSVWTVPELRMKAGIEHRVPLSDRAVDVLIEARDLAGSDCLVFPSITGRVMSDSTLSKLLLENGIGGTPHGMRSAFRDWASECTNAPHAVMEAALAHTVRDKAEAAYARSDLLDKRRELMDEWARYLSTSKATAVRMEGRP